MAVGLTALLEKGVEKVKLYPQDPKPRWKYKYPTWLYNAILDIRSQGILSSIDMEDFYDLVDAVRQVTIELSEKGQARFPDSFFPLTKTGKPTKNRPVMIAGK